MLRCSVDKPRPETSDLEIQDTFLTDINEEYVSYL